MAVKIKQRDITDCGAACIASIAAHYRLHVPIARIRQLASTDKKGTNVLGLIEGLEKLGFEAKGVRGDLNSLSTIPLPAIAHVIIHGKLLHYVVLDKVTEHQIQVMDPADGEVHRIPIGEFQKMWTGVLVLTVPAEGFTTASMKTSAIARFWTLIQPHKRILLEVFVGSLAYTIIGLSTSIYVQKIVDHVLVDGNRNLLNLMSVGMIALLLLQVVIGAIRSTLTLHTGQAIDATLILGYYRHLLRLPQSFFDTMRVGEIISRVNDAVKIRSFVNEALTGILVNVLIVVLSFALMFTYNWKLAGVIALIVPFYGIVYVVTNLLNKKVERKLMERGAELEAQLVESLNAMGTIKSLGLEQHASIRTESRFVSLLQKVYVSGLNSIFTGSSSEFLSRLFTIIMLWAGARFVLDNEITPGQLLSFYALLGYFTGPVTGLISANKIAQNAFIAADRLFEILDLETVEQENTVELSGDWKGDIRFHQVTFKYGSQANVFENLNLVIPRGRVTAIVGESGSGKSTLMALLQNLYPIHSGHILLGEVDLRYIRQESLQKHIAVVPQKIDLFAGNVVENIAIGDMEPDMPKIMRICTELNLTEFIEKLPAGFNSYLGENGATLSGGQKQRIAIARALYRDPDILLLDEATSSLDSASEHYVQRAVSLLREKQKTVILIAHRLSTVYRADKIVVIENGKVAEMGEHHDLLQNRKQYYSLWKAQFTAPAEEVTDSVPDQMGSMQCPAFLR